jgi:hypothetical protein
VLVTISTINSHPNSLNITIKHDIYSEQSFPYLEKIDICIDLIRSNSSSAKILVQKSGSVTLSFLRHFRTDFFGPSTGGGSSGILDRNNKILVDLIADERRSREKLETSIWDNCKLPPINYSILHQHCKMKLPF